MGACVGFYYTVSSRYQTGFVGCLIAQCVCKLEVEGTGVLKVVDRPSGMKGASASVCVLL